MISEIRINSPAANYHEPTVLRDLRRINFIFGANGSGKTTISRVIDQADGHTHCELGWQGGQPLDVMVYNRDFIDRNFNQESPLQGVFTLGENQVEAEQQIARLQPEIERVREQITSLRNQLDGEDGSSGKRKELADLEPVLREQCWRQKQLHDDYFQAAFSGVRNNQERFKEKVLSEKAVNQSELLSLEALKRKAETVFASGVESLPLLGDLSADELIAAESHLLLQKPIVGSEDVDIARLINRLGSSDWVRQGLKYHEQDPSICPFCQQQTDEGLAKSFASFFNDAYDEDVRVLVALQNHYSESASRLGVKLQRYIDSSNQFLNKELFDAEAQALTERLKRNDALLHAKLSEPSRKVSLEPISSLLTSLQNLITQANEATAQHNQTVANIAAEKQILTSQIWRYVLNELSAELSQYENAKTGITAAIRGMEGGLQAKNRALRELNDQVRELERQSTSIQPTKDAINSLLQAFGFHSFLIEVVDDRGHYRISRQNGEDASRTLSEGEKTFITFLYFYSLIKGAHSASGVTTNRIVVFDDPISSLDSDVLYIVSSLIKEVIEETRLVSGQIKQVFVLTHNVYFHKEITYNRKRHLDSALTEESFWLVKKLQHGSTVERCEANPIRSAYELLWEDVKSGNIANVSLQNTLRRILENYFTMWGGLGKDEICSLFEGRDRLICQSLFSWVNDGSHSIHDDLYINHGERTNEAYLRVFREIFDRAGQLGHYEMMTAA
jgi:wobble nucleotide-excising tRNase